MFLALQGDNNLVIYESGGVPRWDTGTALNHRAGTAPTRLIMQNDGNLVLYDSIGRALWDSGTGR